MSFRGRMPSGRVMTGLLGLLLTLGAAHAQTTITVYTNKDLLNAGSTGEKGRSLRDAIIAANAVPPANGVVTIDFDPTVFIPNQPLNASNTIIIGDPTLRPFAANFPWAVTTPATAGVAPLPTIYRSNVRIDADYNNDGISDVSLDLTNLTALQPTAAGTTARPWGLRIANRDPWAGNTATPPEGVIIEGLTIRNSAQNPLTVEESVAGVQIGDPGTPGSGGTGHAVRGCIFTSDVIGVETNVTGLADQVNIGSFTSSGYGNSFTGCLYSGMYIRNGAGQVVVQNSTFSGCGNALYELTGGLVIEATDSAQNLIGATDSQAGTSAGNTFSGNLNGAVIKGTGPNVLQQNTFSANTRNGIRIRGSGANQIGGSSTRAGNTVTGNGPASGAYNHAGILVDSSANGANVFYGNRVTGNGGAGLQIDGDGNNQIGGTATGAGNTFSDNGAVSNAEYCSGIVINGDGLHDGNNTIENNTVTSNNRHGIEVAGNGTTTIGGTQAASSNTISQNNNNGIRLQHSGRVYIKGNLIGSTGQNFYHGIEISDNVGAVNVIGGTAAAERNVISGNGHDGIAINAGSTNYIYGNYIGVTAAGTGRQANGGNGITLSTNATGANTIGSSVPGQRNVISGNTGIGIAIYNTPSGAQNRICGNYIGVDAGAANAIGNTGGGIVVEAAASSQVIGGMALGEGNVIAGNGSHGIRLGGSGVKTTGSNTVIGNLIGAVPANPTGYPLDARLTVSVALRNQGAGIMIGADATGTIKIGYGAQGTDDFSRPYEGNIIVNNTGRGIEAAGTGVLTAYHNFIGAGLNSLSAFVAMPNGLEGILISGSGNNVIGGDEDTPYDSNKTKRNVIAGNTGAGINITGPGANQIINNRIGVDFDAANAAGNGSHGVVITGTGNNLLRNNRIGANTGCGVSTSSPGTTTLKGNRIGRTLTTEPAAFANASHGVAVPNAAAGYLVLGGLNTGEANTVSGNAADGVNLLGNVTNSIVGNYIGTDINGSAALGNGTGNVTGVGSGVLVQGTTVTPVSGGATVTASDILANTISGNRVHGVNLVSGTNILRRNRIGTDSLGLAALGNSGDGVYVNDPNVPANRKGIIIGQRSIANVDNGNVISGNVGSGVHVLQGGGDSAADNAADVSDDILIQNNRIGVNSAGTAALANGIDGIRVETTCNGRFRIGGPTEGDGNILSGNTGWGLRYEGQYSWNTGLGLNNEPLIVRNIIGANVQGEVAIPNRAGGVLVNVIAGPLANDPRRVPIGDARPTTGFAFANLISGNTGPGLQCSGTAGRWIKGNYIGVDAYQRNVMGNGGDGILIDATVTGQVIIGDNVAPPGAVTTNLRNLVAGNGGWGIRVSGPLTATTTTPSLITGNLLGCSETVTSGYNAPFGTSGGGNAGGLLVETGVTGGLVTVGNNVVRRSASVGIATTSASTLTVATNTVLDSTSSAMVLGGSGPVNASNNTLTQNTGVGASLTGTGAIAFGNVGALAGNLVSANTGGGVSLNGSGTYTLTGNTITQNTGHGLDLVSATGAVIGSTAVGLVTAADTVNRNTITSNTGHGINVQAGSRNRLSENLIQDNGVNGGVFNGTSKGIANPTPAPLAPPQLDYLKPVPSSGVWTVAGTATGGALYVEIYEARDPNPANVDPLTGSTYIHNGQVEKFVARARVDAISQRFTYDVPAGFTFSTASRLLTALSIDANGNTSEYGRNTGMVDLTKSVVQITSPAGKSIPADGVTTATATVTIRDAIGTKLPGVPTVVIKCKDPLNWLTPNQAKPATADPTGQTTDLNGTVTATFTSTSPSPNATTPCASTLVTVGAAYNGTDLTSTDTFTVGIGAPDKLGSTIAADPTTGLIANGTASSTITLTLKDKGTNQCATPNVAASRVKIVQIDTTNNTVLGSPTTGVTITQPTAATNAGGQTTGSVVSTKIGTYTFGFSVDGTVFTDSGGAYRTVTLTFVPGPVNVDRSSFYATPTTVLADGSAASTLTMILHDANDNPIANVAPANFDIVGAPVLANAVVKGPATDATGKTDSSVTSNRPGTVVFTATANGVALKPATVIFSADKPSDSHCRLDANPLQARPNGTDTITLTATVKDQSDNPVKGVSVNVVVAVGTGVTIVGPSAVTNDNGQTTATATATQAGTVTFAATALVSGNTINVGTRQVEFRLLDPDATRSYLSATFDDPLLANGTRAAHCTLTCIDALGGPIPGIRPDEVTVTAAIPNAGGTVITGPSDASDGTGKMTFLVTSTVAGTAAISVKVRGATIDHTNDTPPKAVNAVFVPFMTQSYGPGLHLMGVAGQPTKPDPRDVLVNLLPDLKLARWDATLQKYLGWGTYSPADPTDPYNLAKNPFAMLAGRGFWLRLASSATFTAVGQPTPNTTFSLPLSKGWNMVANPFPSAFRFSMANMTVYQNGNLVGTLEQSAARALVEPYGWRWDPVLMYLLLVDPSLAGASNLSGTVEVGRGWWWLCRADGIEVRLQPSTAGRAVTRAASRPGEWLGSIEASAGDGQAQAMFGAAAQRLRAELPPEAPVPAPVEVAFTEGTKRCASDVRVGPLTSRQTWNLAVTSRQAGDVTLGWKGLARALPSGHRLWLSDPTTGKRLLMNTRTAYTYTGEAGTRNLVVSLDPHGARTLQITDLQVSASRSRGRATGLTLTLTCEAQVTVTVKGLAGRLVRQYAVDGHQGTNTISWDGRDNDGRPVPAGTYQVEVTASTDEGEIARVQRALTVR